MWQQKASETLILLSKVGLDHILLPGLEAHMVSLHSVVRLSRFPGKEFRPRLSVGCKKSVGLGDIVVIFGK